jgi:hypothetical protein
MRMIRTSKFNTAIKKPSSALFLWFHSVKGWLSANRNLSSVSGVPGDGCQPPKDEPIPGL